MFKIKYLQFILNCMAAVVAIAAGMSALMPAAYAQTTTQNATYDINLPAQPLASAIAALSKQTGAQILAAGELVAGRQAPALSGRMTARDALNRLLGGSGLEAAASASGFVVQRAAPVAQDEQQLEEVKVRAAAPRESATGP